MIGSIARKIFGTANDRRLKSYRPRIAAINALEPELAQLSDADLQARTQMFRDQLAQGAKLDDLLVPAFATVREASKRVLGQRHFDVQLIGGIVLHEGAIAEMRTGEGKTLVATLATYLNALPGKGVHVVTVNDYLAKRDSEWMGQIYNFLGLSVGIIIHGLDDEQRKASYACDITYGTNNEFGFDYLRDNMKYDLDQMAQRGHNYAIVDEVDSILIDEARTPLIISGPSEDKSDLYNAVDAIMPYLVKADYDYDEKQRSVSLTDAGNEHVEEMLRAAGILKEGSLYEAGNATIVHHVQQALKAHNMFTRDKDYIVQNGEVVIIDEFSGRMMQGRRYSEGLHQAIEAKEHVQVQPENVTLASITFQNFFRLYKKLSGMTGTALTEANEFHEIYKLEVVEIPTNVTVQRYDDDDEVYRSAAEKYKAVVREVESALERKQPVLVGTASIEKSEVVSELLKEKGIPHQVLNARYHEQEAQIIADAGVPGAVTIATNMAGRGTDIKLGGNLEMHLAQEVEKAGEGVDIAALRTKIEAEIERNRQAVLKAEGVIELEPAKGSRPAKTVTRPGGLYIIGTERHESRRIDNQLRGRSGRQGDAGRSKFFLSLEDDLMRIFGSERMDSMLQRLGLKPDEAIIHPWINKALEKAQQKVEARNFDQRKNVLKYDDVMNDQRKVVFEQRRDMMAQDSLEETVADMRSETIEDLVTKFIPADAYPEAWDVAGLHAGVVEALNLDLPIADWAKEEGIADEELRERIHKAADEAYLANTQKNTVEIQRYVEKQVILQVLDHLWRDHLVTLDHLRQVIGWRGYAQRDPLNEYKSEAFDLFSALIVKLRETVTAQLMRVQVQFQQPDILPPTGEAHHLDPVTGEEEEETSIAEINARIASGVFSAQPVLAGARDPQNPETWGKVSRNEDCPCGSGKKYKHCHGVLA